MSRFGNDRIPTATGEGDVLHSWALVDTRILALEAFAALERRLDEVAQQMGVLTLGAPMYETFRPNDPFVPAVVRAQAELCEPVGVLWLVHGWVRFQPRPLPVVVHEAAVDVPDLVTSGGP